MLIYKVVENHQEIDNVCYDTGRYTYDGKRVKVLKLCSSLEIAERFLSTLLDNHLITIKEDNLYHHPDDPNSGPERYPEIVINKFTIEAIEIE
jgi:hypothetical protein